ERQQIAVRSGARVHQLGRLDAAQFRWPRRGAGADRERDGAPPSARRDHGRQSARYAAKLAPRSGRHLYPRECRGGRLLCAYLFHDQSQPVGAREGAQARPAAACRALMRRARESHRRCPTEITARWPVGSRSSMSALTRCALSAAGVLAGIPYADGVVGDLGGGSVELVRVDATTTPAVGAGVSLPLGPLRLAEFGDNRKAVIEQIEAALPAAPVLRECAGRALYLVGGAWRAIARLHIEQTRYPLHIIHQYKIARRPAEAFLELIAAQSRRSLERVTGMSRRRLEVVPLAATILRRLIAAGRPDRLVFSAFGLREGYAYGVL